MEPTMDVVIAVGLIALMVGVIIGVILGVSIVLESQEKKARAASARLLHQVENEK